MTLAETTFAAAWNVQGDPSRAPFADEARRLFGLALPDVPNTTARHGALTALWLGPTSWLLVASDASALDGFAAQRDAVNAAGGALFDVTASSRRMDGRRATRRDRARQALPARLPRARVSPKARARKACSATSTRSSTATISSSFTLLVARSYAHDVWRTLCQSAAQYGYDVLPPRSF